MNEGCSDLTEPFSFTSENNKKILKLDVTKGPQQWLTESYALKHVKMLFAKAKAAVKNVNGNLVWRDS